MLRVVAIPRERNRTRPIGLCRATYGSLPSDTKQAVGVYLLR